MKEKAPNNSEQTPETAAADQASTHAPASHTDPTQARRRFLKAGLIGVPMIVTLRSRPAYAALGTGGVFYGLYGQKSDDGNGNEVWVPVVPDGSGFKELEGGDRNNPGAGPVGPDLDKITGPGYTSP